MSSYGSNVSTAPGQMVGALETSLENLPWIDDWGYDEEGNYYVDYDWYGLAAKEASSDMHWYSDEQDWWDQSWYPWPESVVEEVTENADTAEVHCSALLVADGETKVQDEKDSKYLCNLCFAESGEKLPEGEE